MIGHSKINGETITPAFNFKRSNMKSLLMDNFMKFRDFLPLLCLFGLAGCCFVSESERAKFEGKCFFEHEEEFRNTFGKYIEKTGYPDLMSSMVIETVMIDYMSFKNKQEHINRVHKSFITTLNLGVWRVSYNFFYEFRPNEDKKCPHMYPFCPVILHILERQWVGFEL